MGLVNKNIPRTSIQWYRNKMFATNVYVRQEII